MAMDLSYTNEYIESECWEWFEDELMELWINDPPRFEE